MRNKGRIEKGEEVHHEKWYMSGTKKKEPSLGGLEPPTFRLTAERANRLRHGDPLHIRGSLKFIYIKLKISASLFYWMFKWWKAIGKVYFKVNLVHLKCPTLIFTCFLFPLLWELKPTRSILKGANSLASFSCHPFILYDRVPVRPKARRGCPNALSHVSCCVL